MSTAATGESAAWWSGVGGAQCDGCGETTIVRRFGDWEDGEQWLCRPCAEGSDEEDDSAVSV